MTTLNKLIAEADAQRNGKWYSGSKLEIAGVGTVNCYRDYSVRKAGFPNHARTTWKLNGKVISQINLLKIVA